MSRLCDVDMKGRHTACNEYTVQCTLYLMVGCQANDEKTTFIKYHLRQERHFLLLEGTRCARNLMRLLHTAAYNESTSRRAFYETSLKNSHVADNRSTPMRNLFVQFHSNRTSTKSLTPMTRKHIQVYTFIRFKYLYINFTAFIQSNHVLDNLLSHHLVLIVIHVLYYFFVIPDLHVLMVDDGCLINRNRKPVLITQLFKNVIVFYYCCL